MMYFTVNTGRVWPSRCYTQKCISTASASEEQAELTIRSTAWFSTAGFLSGCKCQVVMENKK